MTYSSLVSRDSIGIAFLVVVLHDLEVLLADVQDAYLNAPTKEKVCTTAGLEFGRENTGHPVLSIRALHGLKSSGVRWKNPLAQTLRDGDFESTDGGPDVWMKPQTKPNGEKYYGMCSAMLMRFW